MTTGGTLAIIRRVIDMEPGWLTRWLERHQTRASFWLHLVGIPLTIVAVGLAVYQLYLWRWDLWYRPVALLAAGYLLQFLGHRHEGNDMGEVILVKRLLGKPYVAIDPRARRERTEAAGNAEQALDKDLSA